MKKSRSLAGKKVLIVGLGRSGIAAARLCVSAGARVTVTDTKSAEALAPVLNDLPASVVRELGGHSPDIFLKQDLVVLSPGVPPLPAIAAARDRGVKITGELELSSWFIDSTMVDSTNQEANSSSPVTKMPLARAASICGMGGTPGDSTIMS